MRVTIDGNEAAVDVAYRLNELCAIYPITPSSTDGRARRRVGQSRDRTNVWGSRADGHGDAERGRRGGGDARGAAGRRAQHDVHGVAGPAAHDPQHVQDRRGADRDGLPRRRQIACRTGAVDLRRPLRRHGRAADGLRPAGLGLGAGGPRPRPRRPGGHASASRVPFVHFFDGFRTSHELNTMERLDDDVLRALVPEELVARAPLTGAVPGAARSSAGTAQNPDVYFQARETVNPFYARVPGIVQSAMDALAGALGRAYRLVEYAGHPEAERVVVVVMGSGAGTARETVRHLVERGERVGVLQVRLYRPFPAAEVVAALPPHRGAASPSSTGRRSPGPPGEPLFLDVVASPRRGTPRGDAGRTCRASSAGATGCPPRSSRPAWWPGIFAELAADEPTTAVHHRHLRRRRRDQPALRPRPRHRGPRDAARGLLRPRVRRHGGREQEHHEDPRRGPGGHAQAYFVYDSKKSGGLTVSHLRFGPHPIRAPCLVGKAGFVGMPPLRPAREGRRPVRAAGRRHVAAQRSPQPPDRCGTPSRGPCSRRSIDKRLRLFAIDADPWPARPGCRGAPTPILQTCFFAISGVLPRDEARRAGQGGDPQDLLAGGGSEVVRRNEAAVDAALAALHEVPVPMTATSAPASSPPLVPASAPRVRPRR